VKIDMLELSDTIVAQSSAVGVGGRSIIRLSGPDALRLASSLFESPEPLLSNQRSLKSGFVRLPRLPSIPADLYLFPSPRTYTGQHMAELHCLGCAPLAEALIAELLNAGARAAQPGEFTLRAFLAGKLDLTRAEAVLGVIEASNQEELKQALAQLAGGVAQPLQRVRGSLLDLLADLEAGLDFAEEDIHFVTSDDQLLRIGQALAELTNLGRQLEQRALADRPFRVALAGQPNAGKSSLFNALTGASALVSAEPGTTRDYLVRRLDMEGVAVEFIDTAGWQPAQHAIDERAQELGRAQAANADLVLVCVESSGKPTQDELRMLSANDPAAIRIATKCDLSFPSLEGFPTSAVTGMGLSELRKLLAERARAWAQPALAPSVSRCRHHVTACVERLRRAHQMVLFTEPPELIALELRGALDEVGEMAGAVYTDDLLDRVFSRFCIGK
jgi:tRNA modification GTPase